MNSRAELQAGEKLGDSPTGAGQYARRTMEVFP